MVKVHLIPQQTIKREVLRCTHSTVMSPPVEYDLLWDPRVWRWACGGPMGSSGHHGMLDTARTLRIPRHAIPAETEEFAAEHGLTWWLDREYGGRAA